MSFPSFSLFFPSLTLKSLLFRCKRTSLFPVIEGLFVRLDHWYVNWARVMMQIHVFFLLLIYFLMQLLHLVLFFPYFFLCHFAFFGWGLSFLSEKIASKSSVTQIQLFFSSTFFKLSLCPFFVLNFFVYIYGTSCLFLLVFIYIFGSFGTHYNSILL